MRFVTLAVAQCGCGEYPVATEVDGKSNDVTGLVCKAGHGVAVLPVYGTSTFVVR